MLSRDLLDYPTLHRRWYGLHNRRGGSKVQSFESMEAALNEIAQIKKRRNSHGYSLVGELNA